jgi:hypothetical protein
MDFIKKWLWQRFVSSDLRAGEDTKQDHIPEAKISDKGQES